MTTQMTKRDNGASTPYGDILNLARVLAASGLFQDAKDEAKAAAKILAGRELGFGPVASLNGVQIIKGKLTMSAGLISAAIKSSGRYDYRVMRLDNDAAELQFLDQGKPAGPPSVFTMEDAKTAGLAGGNTYKAFGRNMLFARSLTNGARWYCPDVFCGAIYTPDELGGESDTDGWAPVTEAAPMLEHVEAPTEANGQQTFDAPHGKIDDVPTEIPDELFDVIDKLHTAARSRTPAKFKDITVDGFWLYLHSVKPKTTPIAAYVNELAATLSMKKVKS